MKATTKVIIEDENGDKTALERAEFLKFFVEQMDIKPIPPMDENGEIIEGAEGQFSAIDTANMLLQLYDDGVDIDWSIPAFAEYEEAYNWMDAILAESEVALRDHAKDAEAKKKAEAEKKEREKKEAEEKRLLAEANQNIFLRGAITGNEKARDAFKSQLGEFAKTLPEGVGISGDVGLVFTEDSLKSPDALGQTIGALSGAETNFDAIKSIVTWLMGDTMNAVIEQGLYKSAIQAGKALSVEFEKIGIKKNPRLFERYGRTAKLCPIEKRNKEVDSSAYLTVAEAAAPKRLAEEKVSDYEERKKKHASDKLKLIDILANGEVQRTEGDKVITEKVTSFTDVKPLVEELQVKHGVKSKPKKDEKTFQDFLLQFFWATKTLELFDDFSNRDGDSIIFKGKEDLFSVDRATLTTIQTEAANNLENIVFGVSESKNDKYTLAQMLSGDRFVDHAVREEGADGKMHIKKNDKGEVMYKKESVKTYPPVPPFLEKGLEKFELKPVDDVKVDDLV